MKLTHLRMALAVLLISSVAVAAAPVFWHLRGHHAVIPAQSPPLQPDVPARPPLDLGQTLAFAPFGSAAVPEAEAPAPQPALQMTLLGVIVRDDPARSLALIDVQGQEANYRPGDELGEDATLISVASDRVTVNVSGTPRILTFEGAERPEEDRMPTGAERLAALMTSGQGGTISERVDAAAKAEPVTTQDYIDLWRDRIRANPAQVLETIGLVPTPNGYRIAEEHDTGVNRAGLQAGDVVTSVNGQSIGDVEKDRALYDAVAASGVARIEVQRNGRTIVMSFPLE
ncbi:Type II secretion system protein C [Sulfitobacter sp. THAF37]|uniref:type II secretion system protein N n=1 Tax=Sulfitobacter sp. THAF37 TaxID=2587855 RepID=UPI00126834DB|nr:type II secretion system protein N [Sulfitobacter sp. THAF37]QFT58106.1 Type II secretion system protein C [Sulfitobacter sp. THAF37]